MTILCHGTTIAGFQAIMSGQGDKSGLGAPWYVSDNDDNMYFYDVTVTAAEWGCDVDDDDYEERSVIVTAQQAYESARLQYAVEGKGGQVVVLICDVPDELIELDYSCHGNSDAMPNARAIRCDEFKPEYIVGIKVCDFNQWHSVAVLQCVWDNDLFNHGEVPSELAAVVDAMHGKECYALTEALYEYEYELKDVDVAEFIEQNA